MMLRRRILALLILVLGLAGQGHVAAQKSDQSELDQAAMKQAVSHEGLRGMIHGANPATGAYVLTVRHPQDFFDSMEISLVPASPEVRQTLARLKRHDQVRVKGAFLNNPSPQPHLQVAEVILETPWQPSTMASPSRKTLESNMPATLPSSGELVGIVHALLEEGRLLVVEAGQQVWPVVVTDPAWTRDLWRGDGIRMTYRTQGWPPEPTHLMLENRAETPLVVFERLQMVHQKPLTLTGALVLFPQSPIINRDVWAIEQTTPEGLTRYFTLVNFDDPDEFSKIDARLRRWWDAESATAVSGRNKFINPKLLIQASGVANIESPNQANPQLTVRVQHLVKVQK